MAPGRKSYSLETKLHILNKLQELDGNVSSTARACKVSRRVVERCRANEAKIRQATSGRKKRGDTMRRRRRLRETESPLYADMEEELLAWITETRKDGILVHGKAIQAQAKEITRSFYGEDFDDFKASRGWLSRFLRRSKLVSRRVTTVGQEIPGNANFLAEKFMADVQKIIVDDRLTDVYVGNMDETPFWFDLPANNSIDVQGIKTVKSKTTGNEKMRFTVVLTALSSGRKLRPMLIFKNLKNVPKGNFPPECVITVAKGGSMTTTLMEQYVDSVWRTRPGSIFRNPALLVLDKHRSHTHDTTVQAFKSRQNTKCHFIPGGMTSLLQPCDLSWNKPMKSRVRQLWSEWLEHGEQQFTRTGKRKRASYDTVAGWIVKAWDELSPDLIKASFVHCGITDHPDQDKLHSSLKTLLETGEVADDIETASEQDTDQSDDSDGSEDEAGTGEVPVCQVSDESSSGSEEEMSADDSGTDDGNAE